MANNHGTVVSVPMPLGRRTFLFGSAGTLAGAVRGSDQPIERKRMITLFNGKNLDGFYTWLRATKYEDPKGVFSVREGWLRISGEDWGGISTRDAYRDYHVILEWKWGNLTFDPRRDKARDGGFLVHATGADGAYDGVLPESIECQIIEGGCGDFILVHGANRPSLTVECRVGPDGQHYWSKGGAAVTKNRGRFNWFGRDPGWKDQLGYRGREDIEKPPGEWNRSEAICAGDSITNVVNGVVVNHGTKASPTAGRIVIKSEGAEILIRRLELMPLRSRG